MSSRYGGQDAVAPLVRETWLRVAGWARFSNQKAPPSPRYDVFTHYLRQGNKKLLSISTFLVPLYLLSDMVFERRGA